MGNDADSPGERLVTSQYVEEASDHAFRAFLLSRDPLTIHTDVLYHLTTYEQNMLTALRREQATARWKPREKD